MKIEIILALVLVSVFVIDYLLRKKKKPQSTEILIQQLLIQDKL